MKHFILFIAAICLAGTMTAQVYNQKAPEKPRDWSGTKIYISPSYGFVAMVEFAEPTASISVGYNLSEDLRVSVTGGYAFGRTQDAYNIALLIGSTELYTSPYSRSYSDIAFGVGYQSNPNVGGFTYFPIRYRFGYAITKNITAGLEAMVALTTKRAGIFMGGAGVFCALRF